ncbi:MAG: hypothetical protein QOI54_2022 [Actinomycetota bacterium]|jgi:hypothetical protein|nr:hypothetical protein [Actinomycetota bacterium]
MTEGSRTAGYSGTPLPRKLGITEGHRVLLAGAPRGFGLGPLPGVTLHRRPGQAAYDVILAFAPDRRTLERRFRPLRERMTRNGGLWIAWPKRSSGRVSDLDENVVRDVGLAVGLVDTKVCAVDETWSALRFVVRLRDR